MEEQMLWDKLLRRMKQEYEISDISFETWLKPLEICEISETGLVLLAPNRMSADYVSKKYLRQMKKMLSEMLEIDMELKIIGQDESLNIAKSMKGCALNRHKEDILKSLEGQLRVLFQMQDVIEKLKSKVESCM